MASLAKAVSAKVASLLAAPAGVNYTAATLSQAEAVELAQLEDRQIITQNVAAELAEKTAGVKYPSIQVYCEKLVNNLREKFRTFSGQAHMALEVRVSQDRLEDLEAKVQLYVDAVTAVLDASRGDWSSGMFYAGGYEAVFGPVKHGGRNFIQAAKVTFKVEISRS